MPDFLKRYRRRGSSLHRDHRAERIAKPAAVGQRFAPQIFVDESGGKGVAGSAGIDNLDFVAGHVNFLPVRRRRERSVSTERHEAARQRPVLHHLRAEIRQ